MSVIQTVFADFVSFIFFVSFFCTVCAVYNTLIIYKDNNPIMSQRLITMGNYIDHTSANVYCPTLHTVAKKRSNENCKRTHFTGV